MSKKCHCHSYHCVLVIDAVLALQSLKAKVKLTLAASEFGHIDIEAF
jgi:hypothetical protein